MREVAGRGRGASELGEIAPAAPALEEPLVLHPCREGEEVDGLAALGELLHHAEYEPVLLCIKGLRTDEVQDVVDGVGLQQEGAEKGAFRLKGLGRNALVGSSHRYQLYQIASLVNTAPEGPSSTRYPLFSMSSRIRSASVKSPEARAAS